jgi:competence protein ComFC
MGTSPASRDSHPAEDPGDPPPARFVWPPNKDASPATLGPVPRATGDSGADEASCVLRPTSLRPATHWWSQVEEAWLGRLSPPFRELAERDGWRPDPQSSACPRCGKSVGLFEAVGFEGETFGCANCRELRLPWSRAIRLGEHVGILRDAVHDTKFTAFRRTGETLGELLGEQVRPVLREAGTEPGEACLVPIPMSLRRRLSRGIHHTLAISRGMSRVLGIRVLNCLSRRHTPSQLEVPASQRGSNVRRSMRLTSRPPEGVRLLILVDDVMTTGATLREGCRAIREGWGRGGQPTAGQAGKTTNGPGSWEIWVATCAVAGEGDQNRGLAGVMEASGRKTGLDVRSGRT